MTRLTRVFLSQLWGILCGATLGAVLTGRATLHLLAKNQALEAAGVVPLPGTGHWETMASWAPAAAGAVFFGLSLGLGAGTVAGLWCTLTRAIPGRIGNGLPWLVLLPALAALGYGDPLLGSALAVIATGSLVVAFARKRLRGRLIAVRAGLTFVIALGLIPWATASEGAFTRLRDLYLLENPLGRLVNEAYYLWTLYPAETLKSLLATTQPTAAVRDGLNAPNRETFCDSALPLGILCVSPATSGWDFQVDDGPVLTRGVVREPWPGDRQGREEAWRRFSSRTDADGPLRRATGFALFVGCPVGLCWLLSGVVIHLADPLPNPPARNAARFALAGALAAVLAASSRPDPALASARTLAQQKNGPAMEEVEALLASEDPVLRFYGARAARRAGPGVSDVLVDALSDPVINVRYAAAEALGHVGGPQAREALRAVLRGSEEWYVKERAYAALWKLGWRPR